MSDKTIFTINSINIPNFLRKYFDKKTKSITVRFSTSLYNDLLRIHHNHRDKFGNLKPLTINEIIEILFNEDKHFIKYAFKTHMLTSFSSMVNFLVISEYKRHIERNLNKPIYKFKEYDK